MKAEWIRVNEPARGFIGPRYLAVLESSLTVSHTLPALQKLPRCSDFIQAGFRLQGSAIRVPPSGLWREPFGSWGKIVKVLNVERRKEVFFFSFQMVTFGVFVRVALVPDGLVQCERPDTQTPQGSRPFFSPP